MRAAVRFESAAAFMSAIARGAGVFGEAIHFITKVA